MHVLGEQGVRAHHDVDRAAAQPLEHRRPLLGAELAGEQLDRQRPLAAEHRVVVEAEPLEVLADRDQVLLGQDLGRGHQGALASAVDRRQQRRQRHHGLARSHVALEQAVHRQRRRHVARDLAEHAALGARQREAVPREEATHQRRRGIAQRARLGVEIVVADGVGHARRGLFEAASAHRQQQLQAQELVEGQPAPGRRHVARVVGQVDPPERPGAVDEVERSAHRLGHRVQQRSRAAQGLLDEAAHLPAGEPGLARRRVDRYDPADLGGVALVAGGADDHVHHRIGHLTLAAVVGDLTEEERLGPHGQLALAPRLVEEDDLEGSPIVAHGRLDHDLALAGAPGTDPSHLGEDRRLVAHAEVAEVDALRAVDVAARIGGQQVEDALDAHRRQRGRALLADVAQLADRHVAQLAESARRRLAHSMPK